MNKNITWLIFLGVVLVGTLWTTGKAGWGIYRFLNLSETAKPDHMVVSVKKKSSNLFVPAVEYDFLIAGNVYHGKEDLNHIKYYRGEFLEQDLPKIKQEENWTVYYNPSNPRMSALSREFPFKNTAYGLIMVGLLGYFFWLGSFKKTGTHVL